MNERINYIITNKISGNQLDSKSSQELSDWLKDKNNQKIYQELEKVWELSGDLNYSFNVNVDKEWDNFKAIRKSNQKSKVLRFSVISIAASIILAIGLFISFSNQPVSYKYATNQSHFVLPDNSEIWLNKGSELELTKQFGEKERTVKLKGEAFFKVEKGNKPFIILTKQGVSVKVLGTSFNVNSSDNRLVNLQVVTGVVEFKSPNTKQLEIVEKGNAATYYTKKNRIETSVMESNKLSWHTGEFIFNNQPLTEVTQLLGEYLSIKIEMPEKLEQNTYSGKFNKPTVNDVAEILGQALDLNYKISNQKLTFYKN